MEQVVSNSGKLQFNYGSHKAFQLRRQISLSACLIKMWQFKGFPCHYPHPEYPLYITPTMKTHSGNNNNLFAVNGSFRSGICTLNYY